MLEDDVKRLKELEHENSRLKRIAVDQALDIAALNEWRRELLTPAAPSGTHDGPALGDRERNREVGLEWPHGQNLTIGITSLGVGPP